MKENIERLCVGGVMRIGKAAALLFAMSATAMMGQTNVPMLASPDSWKADQVPFSFKYDGKESGQFLSTWQRNEEAEASEGGELRRYIFSDPATKLKVTAEVRTFKDYPAVDWVLQFTNDGSTDTSIIEDVQPLHWTIPVQNQPILHWALGSNASRDDFAPRKTNLAPGQSAQLNSSGGRSSNNNMPFFNLQDGDQGVIGAIGWTGNWIAHFNPASDGKTISMDAGMQKTHFLLHGGETVRPPRIVLLNWKGDRGDSQNLWRRFVLSFYSPRESKGQTVTAPVCFGTWGTELAEAKLAKIKELNDRHIPFDAYWVDAGWYGNLKLPPNKTVDYDSKWFSQRGSWTPNPALYPSGFKPMGDALKESGHGFLLWLEGETADKGSTVRTAHPDWFMPDQADGSAILNLANPDARKGITDLVSNLIDEAGMTWYRQDYNVEPERSWAAMDAPDRIGIEEMNYVTGLYKFWDDLRTRHPGLQIDNCASGGRRLDIETISRSVALWRSDYGCGKIDPSSNQMETQALNIWVPLNAGVYASVASGTPNEGASLIYAIRSSYSAGWVFGLFDNEIIPDDIMRPAAEEFDEVRPFFRGDMYPLTDYSGDLSAWAIVQWHRPDLKAGVVLVLHRQQNTQTEIKPGLRAIEPTAQYKVEIRTGFEKGAAKIMTGEELTELSISAPDKPGSALVLYQQQ